MKCVEAMLLLGICRPCLTVVQQDAEDTGRVHLKPSVQCYFSRTIFVSLDMEEEALPMRLLISTSLHRLLVNVEPK